MRNVIHCAQKIFVPIGLEKWLIWPAVLVHLRLIGVDKLRASTVDRSRNPQKRVGVESIIMVEQRNVLARSLRDAVVGCTGNVAVFVQKEWFELWCVLG